MFHVYGRDGVMGPLEPVRGSHPHEIGSVALHVTYPGRKAIAGNLALFRVEMLEG
jgi:hypothetical protein